MNYEILLKEADELHIIVKEKNLRTKDGFCYGNRIAINKKLETTKEKYCILSEELGHYHMTVGDITDQTKIQNRKQELIARRWGYEHTVSLVGLITAFEYGSRGSFEIAEFLGVTEKYLSECLDYYKRRYGLYHTIENYIIYFEPNLFIGKSFNPVL